MISRARISLSWRFPVAKMKIERKMIEKKEEVRKCLETYPCTRRRKKICRHRY